MTKLKKLIRLELLLIFISFIYYLFFVNKGLVLFDEGYFVHSADRILNGQIPYQDFSLQYGPTYFYILALLYKIFGPSIIVGRFLTLSICILIITTSFLIFNKLKINSWKIILLAALSLVSFGFPLISIPNIIWANVLLALLLVLTYIYWNSTNKYRYLFIMGILLALSISCKQNFGVVFVVLYTPLVLFAKKQDLNQRIKNLIVLHGTWIILTLTWIYFFFLRNNLQGLFDLINYGKRFAMSTVFSYPPLTFIFQPLGIFKLLPYYLPLILLLITIFFIFKRYRNWNIIAFCLTAGLGFFTSVYPQSDLLHCYPFLGMVLISFLLLPFKGKLRYFVIFIASITILSGFYLSLFTKSYRYESYYHQYDTYLNLPRANNILVTKDTAKDMAKVSKFINVNTSKKDYIFVYPYSPMLYFLLERGNPSKDAQYYLRIWHFYDDKVIISEIKDKKVRYIITSGDYKFDMDLSRFILKQKRVLGAGQFQIFEVKS